MAEKCAFIKEDGTRCRANPLTGDRFCINHSQDPKAIEIKAAAVKKGGRVRTQKDNATAWTYRPIDNTEDLKAGLSELFNAGMLGKISTSQLSSLSNVANALQKLLQPPREENKDPDSMRVILLRFLEERHPEIVEEFIRYLEELDAQ